MVELKLFGSIKWGITPIYTQFKKLHQMKTTENTDKLLNFVAEKFEKGELTNDSLVQLIELCGAYLNLQTISDYAKDHQMSYDGVKHHREIKEIFNQKYVIDND